MILYIDEHTSHCMTSEDGDIIFNIILPLLNNNKVTVSFDNIDTITPSFIHSAFLPLLKHFTFDFITTNLNFIDSNKYINNLIIKSFNNELILLKKV